MWPRTLSGILCDHGRDLQREPIQSHKSGFREVKRKKQAHQAHTPNIITLIHHSPIHDVTPTKAVMATYVFRNKFLHKGEEKCFELITKNIQLPFRGQKE